MGLVAYLEIHKNYHITIDDYGQFQYDDGKNQKELTGMMEVEEHAPVPTPSIDECMVQFTKSDHPDA